MEKKKSYLKRFFRPITQNWNFFLLGLLDPLFWGIHAPLVVYFFKQITLYIELGDKAAVQQWLIYFIVFLLVSYPLKWVVK